MNKTVDYDTLYPFQDIILKLLNELETGFYLTGGTAASRGYLNHRFSDDLDFFVNDDKRFDLWAGRIIQVLTAYHEWSCEVLQKDERFIRLALARENIPLKIELINDIPAHVGDIRKHAVLGRLDSPENILANKITALIDRGEPKDLADIWGFCLRKNLSLSAALEEAQSKAAGIFPADLARALCSVTSRDWELVRWIQAPEKEDFLQDLKRLGEKLILNK